MSSGGSSLGAQSQIPAIRPFQMDPGGLGAIADAVNLFRGEMNLPLSLVTLPGRGGLQAEARILCSSNVGKQVETWNLVAPTGPLGLGWTLGYDFIALESKTTAAPTENVYYLISGGVNRLYRVADTPDYSEFQLARFEFWIVRYYPAEERWVIIKENGQRSTYGGRGDDAATSPLQYGVKWGGADGNWVDGSSQRLSQTQFVIAWNLAEVANPWGDLLTFRYDNDVFRVGGDTGAEYTRASRLAGVVDPTGESMTFQYEPKEYNASIREYEYPHVDPSSPTRVAYQDRFDTRYLASIDVRNASEDGAEGRLRQRITFAYDVVNTSSQPQSPDLYKRYLTGITQWTADGLPLPPLTFGYYNRAEDRDAGAATGALREVTYPQGGVVRYTYEATELQGTSYDLALDPLGTPRVFFGPDYTIVTHVDRARRGLQLRIYSWNGLWVEDPQSYSFPDEIDLQTLNVAPESESFALSFHTKESTPRLYAILFHKERSRFGHWTTETGFTILPIGPAGKQGIVAAGRSFAVAVTSSGEVMAKVWDPPTRSWLDRSRSITLPRADRYALVATGRVLLLAAWTSSSQTVSLSLYYLDDTARDLRQGSLAEDRLTGVLWQDGTPSLFFSPAADFTAITYITRIGNEKIDYSVRALQWDDRFRGAFTLTRTYQVAASSKTPFAQSVSSGSVVGNVEHILRFDGVNWVEAALTSKLPGDKASFAFGNDAAIVVDGSATSMQLFNGFDNRWHSVSSGPPPAPNAPAPTIGDDYVTVGTTVFRRTADLQLQRITDLDPNMDPASLTNRAPLFFAYQDGAGSTQILPVRNGQLLERIPLTAERIVAGVSGPGTSLVGRSAMVTFRGATLDDATGLTLHQFVNESLSGPVIARPVTSLAIDDGFDDAWGALSGREKRTLYRYDCANATVTPDGSVIEFSAATAVYGVEAPRPGGCYPPPERTLFGSSELRYHNNRTPFENGFVLTEQAAGEAANAAYTELVGLIYDRTDRDGDGVPVSRQVSHYEVRNEREPLEGGPLVPLWGSYVKLLSVEDTFYEKVIPSGDARRVAAACARGTVDRALWTTFASYGINASAGRLVSQLGSRVWAFFPDPGSHVYFPVAVLDDEVTASVAVIRRVDYLYSLASGQTLMQATASHDSTGDLVTKKSLQFYAWQVAAYRALRDAHILAPLALSVTLVDSGENLDPKRGVPTELTLTSYKEWFASSEEGVTKWAAWRTFAAATAAVYDAELTPPARFDWTAEALPSDGEWRRTSEVRKRLASGPVVEALDASGRPTATIFDRSASFQVASASNTAASELAYAGFEAYETLAGWRLSSGQPVSSRIVRGDAHTGSAALALAADVALETAVTLDDPARKWLLSCWVKTPESFGGSAAWHVNGQPFPIEPTGGTWAYRAFPLSPGTRDVTLRATGDAGVLLDDIFFAPVAGGAEAMVFHEQILDLEAVVGFSGTATRSLLDSRRRPVVDIGVNGNVTTVAMPYTARLFREERPFDGLESDPDQTLEITPTDPSRFASFTTGDEWRAQWSGSGEWRVAGGALVHASSSDDTMTWSATANGSDYGVRVSVVLPVGTDGKAQLPRKPLGIRLGDRFSAQWQPSGGWRITLDGQSTSVTTGTSRFQNDWLVCAATDPVSNVTSLLFYADGRLLFARDLDAPLSGAFSIFVQDAGIGFHGIAAFRAPRLSTTFTDGSGKERQRQALAGRALHVTGTLYDPVGRAAIPVKTTPVPGGGFRYIRDLVTAFDPVTGVMKGLASDFHAEDGGYPYARTDFYRSPLGLARAQGLPGRDFAIVGKREGNAVVDVNPHITTYDYGTNGGAGWDPRWPAGQYFVLKSTDPDGGVALELRSKTDEVVARLTGPLPDGSYATLVQEYDAAGRVVRVLYPNHFATGAPGDAFVTTNEFDFLGQMLETDSSDSGRMRFVADRAGQERFAMLGTENSGPIVYTKYDALGRTIEQGWFTGTWDRTLLTQKALNDPAWPDPSQPHTVTAVREYDGDGSVPSLVGKLVRSTAFDGESRIVQTFTYDLAGPVTSIEQMASEYDQTPRIVQYGYNAAGDTIRIGYPADSAVTDVVQSYDRIGQVWRIGTPGAANDFGVYSYTAAGALAGATLDPLSAKPIERTIAYNPPGWPAKLHAEAGGRALFTQSVTYTSGGYQGAGYYGGQAASDTFGGEASTPYAYRYQFDRQRQLEVAENTSDASASLGVGEPLTYDPNGNFLRIREGDATRSYTYDGGTDRVQRVEQDGAALEELTYDDGGAVTSSTRNGIASIDYDAVVRLASRIRATDGKTLTFRYGADGERVVKKESASGGGETAAKLYVRGTSLLPLAESARTGGSQAQSQFVYGPDGLQALLAGGHRYTVLRDRTGSVRAVVDEERNVVASFEYQPFGTVIRRGGTAPDLVVYRFTGQELDTQTSLYNFNARLYDPWLGRFYAVDPKSVGFSPYVYAANDPLDLNDPTGEEPLTAFLIMLAIGAVVGLIAGAVTYLATYGTGNFDVGKFLLYAGVGLVAGAVGAVVGYGAGALAVTSLAAAGVSTSTSIGSGIFVGAVTAGVEGMVSSGLTQIGNNLIEKREWNEDLGRAVVIGGVIGAAVGGLAGGITGKLNQPVARRLAGGDVGASINHGGLRYNTGYLFGKNPGFRDFGTDLALAVRKTRATEILSLGGHGSPSGNALTADFGASTTATNLVVGTPMRGFRGAGVNLSAVCYSGRNGIARELASAWNVPVRGGTNVTTTSRRLGTTVANKYSIFARYVTIYPSRLQTGWVSIFGY